MANEEHVAILKQGVDVWSDWRMRNLNVSVDLREIDLRGINFSGGHFGWVDFGGANLSEADFSEAYLRLANLKGAYLVKADFRRANLRETNLVEADLHDVDFRKAKLGEADLSRAKLGGAILYGAMFGRTIFSGIDLSEIVGLEEARHWSRSTLDLSVLQISKGKIPEAFLRGIGWSEPEIEFILPLYKDNVIESYSGFISYSTKDDDFAQRLYNDLQGAGIRVWFAPEDLKGGDEFWKVINKEIRLRDKLILVLSENSVNSEWVAHEVEQAFEEEKVRNEGLHPDEPIDPVLLPVTIDDAVFECKQPWATKIRRDRNIRLMQQWKNHDEYQKGLDLLIKDLKGN